jgi:hypothetical protein
MPPDSGTAPPSGALCTLPVIAEFIGKDEKTARRRIASGSLHAVRHYDPVVGGRGFYWTMAQTAAGCNSGSWGAACAAWDHPLAPVTVCSAGSSAQAVILTTLSGTASPSK